MIRQAILPGLCLLASAVSMAVAAETAIETRPWDDYEVLIERNIFSRQRGRRAVEQARPPAPPPPPAQRFVRLRGITKRGDELTAFLEDTRSGETIVAHEGSLVVNGKVTKVDLDGIRYDLDGKEVEVGIGDNLEASAAPVLGSSGSGASGAGTGSSARADSEEAMSIIERLKRRRMEEIGQ